MAGEADPSSPYLTDLRSRYPGVTGQAKACTTRACTATGLDERRHGDPHLDDDTLGWYDPDRGLAIIQRSEYSMTANSMSHSDFLRRLADWWTSGSTTTPSRW